MFLSCGVCNLVFDDREDFFVHLIDFDHIYSYKEKNIRICELCGCEVVGFEKSWDCHIKGKYHKRNAKEAYRIKENRILKFEKHLKKIKRIRRKKILKIDSHFEKLNKEFKHDKELISFIFTTVCSNNYHLSKMILTNLRKEDINGIKSFLHKKSSNNKRKVLKTNEIIKFRKMLENIQIGFECPITLREMKDACILTTSRQTYDSKEIKKWFEVKNFDPVTRKKVEKPKLIKDVTLQKLIKKWNELNVKDLDDLIVKTVSKEIEGDNFEKDLLKCKKTIEEIQDSIRVILNEIAVCPLTNKLLNNPVILPNGKSYEKKVVIEYFSNKNTKIELLKKNDRKEYFENFVLKNQIHELRKITNCTL